ncbi:hypothetical protein JCM19047_109 [Bacillus sp. JCM 19047]|nr:hypothetical protein JCM19047_109 [Bacillus sp. JCM 19047]
MDKNRLDYLDFLKVFMAIFIVTVHVALAYAPGIWWFYKSLPEDDWLLVYYQIINPIAMALFFLLSAYFFPASFDKKGAKKFMKGKLIRVGVPFIAGVFLLIIPLHFFYHLQFRDCGYTTLYSYTWNMFFGIGGDANACHDRWLDIWPDLKVAHLWFLQHLLIYASIYTLIRLLVRKKEHKFLGRPSNVKIVAFILVLTTITFAMRTKFPLDYWNGFLGAIQMEYANVPKYALFVILGVLLYRTDWLTTFPIRRGMVWLGFGFILLLTTLFGYEYIPFFLASGEFSLNTFLWTLWDCFMTVSLGIGLIVLFREGSRYLYKGFRQFSQNTYGVYLFHVPIVVFVQYFFRDLSEPIYVRFLIECVVSVLISFAFTHFIRKSKTVRKFI